jgi:hypothetical protein
MDNLGLQKFVDILWTCNSLNYGHFVDLQFNNVYCRNPTLAKCGGEAQHLEKLEVWSPPGLPNV